jgi:Tetratricopeptide repeat
VAGGLVPGSHTDTWAIALYERTLADRERVLGDTHPQTSASRNNLATAYQDAGRLDEAEDLRDRWAQIMAQIMVDRATPRRAQD